MLQWGRNFIVAETVLAGLRPKRSAKLQWGRNFIVAETPCTSTTGRTASTRFNGAATLSLRKPVQQHQEQRIHHPASMGPQLYRCGNGGLCRGYHTVCTQLQWGRNFIVAETYAGTVTRPMTENRFNGAATLSLRKPAAGAPTASSSTCFNGAATLSLRKLAPPGAGETVGVPASMVPQLYRCGNLSLLRDAVQHVDASMGPQLYRCGNPYSNSLGAEIPICFNGAATLSLRKLGPACLPNVSLLGFNGAATLSLRKPNAPGLGYCIQSLLQWGRNFIVAETCSVGKRLVAGIAASMGPQLYRCGNWFCPCGAVNLNSASMGPQLYRCGNQDRKDVRAGHNLASMGPQLYRCGNAKK